MVSSFKKTSVGLCNAVAHVARRLAREFVDPSGLEALLANRGIPLNKNPGLRPIGVGEILRRIIGKAILGVVGIDVQKAVGPLQLCAGQSAGAAVHAMRNFFEDDDTDGILLIDADNAFNSESSSRSVECPVCLSFSEICFDQHLSLPNQNFCEWQNIC